MAPRKTEDNAFAKFWGDKQRALWYVMVFSGVRNLYPAVKGLSTKQTVSLGNKLNKIKIRLHF